jgi:hypothetical protein
MALNTATYNKNGEQIKIEISFGYAQVGAYKLYLWDSSGKKKTELGEGMNTDNVPDIYTLEKPLEEYNSRIVDCVTDVISPTPQDGEKYSVNLSIQQNGIEIGKESDTGDLDAKTMRVRLAIKLSC